MSPKTAKFVLLLAFVTVLIVFIVSLYNKNNNGNESNIIDELNEVNNYYDIEIKKVLEKEMDGDILSIEEEEFLNKAIDEKVTDKFNEIENRGEKDIKEKGFSQEEVDFIANPRKTIKEEILDGDIVLPNNKKIEPYTQDELDSIANPK